MCDTSRHSSIFTIASLLELSQVVSERRARLLGFPLRNIIPLRNAEQVILCVTLAQEPCYPARLLRVVATSLLLEVFWSSADLTGNQTASVWAVDLHTFWSSADLTGNQTDEVDSGYQSWDGLSSGCRSPWTLPALPLSGSPAARRGTA